MHIDRSVWSINNGQKKITLISLVIPLLMQQIFTQLYGTANIILLKGYSEMAVTASSIANQVLDISVVLMNMAITGTVIITSIELGAGERKKAARIAGTGAILVLGAATIVAAVNFFAAEVLMSFMKLEGETLALACDYYRIRVLFIPVVALMNFFNHLLIANGFSKYTLIVGISSNLLNLGFSALALYAPFTFMTPVPRVAIAVGIAQIFGVLFAILFFKLKKCPYEFCFVPKNALKILKFGIPSAMVSVMFRIAQTITTSFVTVLGEDVINTKIYIGNIVAYIPLLCFSIGQANSVLMGRFKGAGLIEKQKILHRQNLMLAFTCNFVLSALVLIFHRPLISMFTSNQDIINASTVIFIADMFVQLPRAINNVSENSLSANGDVKTIFITSTLSCWLGSVALSYVLCVVCNLGLIGLWISFIADESLKSIIYIFRWKSGKWQNINV